MMKLAIEPLAPPLLDVQGTDLQFPVRHIYGIGRNYSDHPEREDKDRENLVVFTKDPMSIARSGSEIPYPAHTNELRYEIELVVALKSGGANIAADRAFEHVYGYAVGLDLTKRDVQERQKAKGRPWLPGKSFDHAAPCTALCRVEEVGHPLLGEIWLTVNGERKQGGHLGQMIWTVPEIIAELSQLFTLRAGDLIFTGTPAGMGNIGPGDVMEGHVDGLPNLRLAIRK